MKILAVHNDNSGQGDSGFAAFRDALYELGAQLEVRPLTKELPLDELLADASNFDRVIAAGGDGTVSAVAHALVGSGVPVLAYPAGTANLIALNLRMPTDPAELARVAVSGRLLVSDLGELELVQERPAAEAVGESTDLPEPPERKTGKVGFALAAGAGFDAAMIAGSEDLKERLGVGAYLASALANLSPTVARLEIELDGETVRAEGIGVMLVNFGRIQLDLKIAPDADAHDGLLEVVVLKARSAAGLAPVVVGAVLERLGLGGGERGGQVEVHRAREVQVRAVPALPVQFDGEVLEGSTPIVARVLAGAVTFVVPEESSEAAEHPEAVVEVPSSGPSSGPAAQPGPPVTEGE